MSDTPASFMQILSSLFEQFAADAGVPPESVEVRIVLHDGTTHRFRGFHGLESGGVLLIRGLSEDNPQALAVRDQHVFKVEFDANPPRPETKSSIGFQTERSEG